MSRRQERKGKPVRRKGKRPGARRASAGDPVVGGPVFERQNGTVVTLYGQAGPTPTSLFVGHADPSEEGRPGIPIARVKEVESLGGVVEPALLIESGRIPVPDSPSPLQDVLGKDRIDGTRRRKEEVRQHW